MMPIDGIINGTNGIINQNRGEESMNAVIYPEFFVSFALNGARASQTSRNVISSCRLLPLFL